MASITIHSLSLTLFFALLFLPNPTFSTDAPESSPSPSPQLPSPPPISPAPSPAFPNSPQAPPPLRLSPDSPSPAPSPADGSQHDNSPSPAPIEAADAGQGDKMHLGDWDQGDDPEGMSGGKKAGIAMGVIAAGCVVGVAAVVYKKRQQNIRRAQYSYTDRRDFM